MSHSISFRLRRPSALALSVTSRLSRTTPFLLVFHVDAHVDVLQVVSYCNDSVLMGRDISVVIATRYGLEDPGIESRREARFSAPAQTGPGANPATYTLGTGSFPGVKRPGRGVGQPPI